MLDLRRLIGVPGIPCLYVGVAIVVVVGGLDRVDRGVVRSVVVVADLELLPVVGVDDGLPGALPEAELVDAGEVVAVDVAAGVAVLAVLAHVAADRFLGASTVGQTGLKIWG